jgi:ribosomal protein S18 acetylase RimI-like enzyme
MTADWHKPAAHIVNAGREIALEDRDPGWRLRARPRIPSAAPVEDVVKAIRLRRMCENEFCTYRDAAVRWYAEDKQRSGDWSSRDALTLSLQAFQRTAPSGLETPNQHLFTIHDAATDTNVGWLWYQVRDDGFFQSVYLCDIMIFDEFQRQGYGTASLAELDNQARSLEIRRVGLHVFGHNTEAVELYQRCGYKITDHVMAKDLQ